MKNESRLSTGGLFGPMRLCVVFLAVLAVLMGFSRSAKADIADCFKSVKRSQVDGREYTVVVFNSEKRCDLYMAARMFPQLDPNTKEPLPPQVQLRSMYAANAKVQFGNREVRTVLARCVPDSKPWPDQTAEERDMCPDLKVNYFQNGFGGAVMIPETRMLTYTEKLESAFSKACLNLGSRQEPSEQEKEILSDCQKLTAGFEYKALPEKEVKIEAPVMKTDDNQTALYAAEIKDLKATVAKLEPKAQKESWLWPLFMFMVGFAVFGASGTIFGVKERRTRKDMEMRYKLLLQETKHDGNGRKNSLPPRVDTEELARKLEKKLRVDLDKEYSAKAAKERLNLEKQFESKYSGISANLARKNGELERTIDLLKEKARLEAEQACEAAVHDLAKENKRLTEELDKASAKASDAEAEAEAFKQELAKAEAKYMEAERDYRALLAENAKTETQLEEQLKLLANLEDRARADREQCTSLQTALQDLQVRHANLLAAQGVMCDPHAPMSRALNRAPTLPIGAAPIGSSELTREGSAYSMVLERGKMRDDQYDEKDKENISSSRFGSAESGGGEDGVVRNPMTTEMDELRPAPEEKDSFSEETTLNEFRLDRDSDDGQESAGIIPRTSHESHTAYKAEKSSSNEEDDKARSAS